MNKVGVIGAGAWGTALAITANRAGSDTILWSRNEYVTESIRQRRINEVYLPDIYIDPAIAVTESLEEAVRNRDFLIISIPSQHVRSTCIKLADLLPRDIPLVLSCKGIERGSLLLMTEVVRSILPNNQVLIISGPNFADEVARGLPSATTLAGEDQVLAQQIVHALGCSTFRPYLNHDIIGTQLGGAGKNVIAIACGIAIGRKIGENARAALITRGLVELSRLCKAHGGNIETLMGLGGVGDLVLTCTGGRSRNYSLGLAIGEGQNAEDIIASRPGVTEGVWTAESITRLAMKFGVRLPICQSVYDILQGVQSVDDAILQLLERPFSAEGII